MATIASQLGVHHYTVERVLSEAGVEHDRQRPRRASKLDPYLALITEALERFPHPDRRTVVRHGQGAGLHGRTTRPLFRHRIAQLRPRRPREAYLRLRTLPGEQAQVDWAHLGKLTIGRVERPLMAFVLVLSYSCYPFVRFYLNASLPSLTVYGTGGRSVGEVVLRAPRHTEFWVSAGCSGTEAMDDELTSLAA